jgi:RND family efflux transporter MFP subunit
MFARLPIGVLILFFVPSHGLHAQSKEWTFPGRLEPVASVRLRAKVPGTVTKVLFKGGEDVKMGQVLLELDSQPARALVEKAEAELARAQAKIELRRAEHQRMTKLFEAKAVSREEMQRAEALLRDEEVQVKLATLRVEGARRDLEASRVVAPFDGTISLPRVSAGQVVGGDKDLDLAILQNTDKVFVSFEVPAETVFRTLKKRLQTEKGPLRFALVAGGSSYAGTYHAHENAVEPARQTVHIRGLVANPQHELLPGQNVVIKIDKE